MNKTKRAKKKNILPPWQKADRHGDLSTLFAHDDDLDVKICEKDSYVQKSRLLFNQKAKVLERDLKFELDHRAQNEPALLKSKFSFMDFSGPADQALVKMRREGE